MIKIKFDDVVDPKFCITSGSRLVSSGLVDREVFKLPIAGVIIADIDKGELITRDVVELPRLDITIPTSSLSGGTQALMYLMSNPKLHIRLNAFGWNCYEYIWNISRTVDYDICLSVTGREQSLYDNYCFTLDYDKDEKDKYRIYCEDSNSYIHNQDEWLEAVYKYSKNLWRFEE